MFSLSSLERNSVRLVCVFLTKDRVRVCINPTFHDNLQFFLLLTRVCTSLHLLLLSVSAVLLIEKADRSDQDHLDGTDLRGFHLRVAVLLFALLGCVWNKTGVFRCRAERIQSGTEAL